MASADVQEVDSTSQDHDVCPDIAQQILATLLGQCIGDAIGLLTEFMTKSIAKNNYGKNPKDLRYEQKVSDSFRNCWENGDWTDDSDQMILILQSILYNKGEVVATDFARRIKRWLDKGFPELGDLRAYGAGALTRSVLHHPQYEAEPERVAKQCWELGGRNSAPNGAVMRTSILGLHQWEDVEKVVENALRISNTTHYDPRCQASVVAVSSCISLMLQQTVANRDVKKPQKLDVDQLIKQSYEYACRVLETDDQKKELWKYMSVKKIEKLELSEMGKIGYTYKCMGTGFWALKQKDFKKALIEVVMQAGDADTNGAVAGALLACKLGYDALPTPWVDELKHKAYLMDLYSRFLKLQSEMKLPLESRTGNDNLSIESLDALAESMPKEKKSD